ncbi:MAG TPA: M12 family metallo-peptidase, partial [Ilumatobacter sp.]|nr:M12 family metallo-peptidase [Ilumatobacter sp.]
MSTTNFRARNFRARRVLVALAASALFTTALAAVPASAQDPSERPEPVLERNMRGEEAIRALGDRLPDVAAQNGMTAVEFRAALRSDSMLWTDTSGQLLFVDEFTFGGDHDQDHSTTADPAWTSAAMPVGTNVWELESRPSAVRVIVLDFNGHDARGTAWGSTSKQIAGAYDSDGDPTTFSQTEQEQIYSVWQRVAEDYAPFDVNVTTKDLPNSADGTGHPSIRRDETADQNYGTRVVITPSQTYNCSCGGVAYVGVFPNVGADHDYYQPAWVFTGGVGTGAKNIAEAASHEAGHNLNLRHDGTRTTGYYTGHGDWAPIMGVGYYEPISQWSKGEYAGANNKEDDLVVMQMRDTSEVARGIGAVPDDVTSAVDVSTGTWQGMIGSANDTDSFTFTTTGGDVSLMARPAAMSANLDIELRLFNGEGILWSTVDPPSDSSDGNDLTSGLDASLDAHLPGGTYTVVLDGVGFGDPASTGYSDYASLGRDTLTVSIENNGYNGGGGGTTDPEPTVPAAPSGFSVTGGADGTATLGWSDNSNNELGFEIQREFLHRSGSFRGTTTWTVGID